MSTTNTKKPKLPVIELDITPTLVLGSDLLSYTSYLHRKVGKKEWSGILFYEVLEGGIKELDKLKMKSNHLMLKDIGTSGSTGYSFDETVLDFYDQFPETEDMKLGMCHTHHNMNNYFSSTDMSELEDNSEHYNYYLSLIMSFDCDYSAKLAFRGKVESRKASVLGDDGKPITISVGEQQDVLYTCDVFVSHELPEYYYDQYHTIKEEAKKAKAQSRKYTGYGGNGYGYGYGGYYNPHQQIMGFNDNITPKGGNPFANALLIRKAISNLVLFDVENSIDINMFVALKRIGEEFEGASNKEIDKYIESVEDFIEIALETHFGDSSLESYCEFCEAAKAELDKLAEEETTPVVEKLVEMFKQNAEFITIEVE